MGTDCIDSYKSITTAPVIGFNYIVLNLHSTLKNVLGILNIFGVFLFEVEHFVVALCYGAVDVHL